MEKKLRIITEEELKTKWQDWLTVGRLKAFLEKHNLPDDAKVVTQRIEDTYFEDHDWGVLEKDTEVCGIPAKAQYHPAWCCVKYSDEDNILFIDLHY